jgi:hypothetical protein
MLDLGQYCIGPGLIVGYPRDRMLLDLGLCYIGPGPRYCPWDRTLLDLGQYCVGPGLMVGHPRDRILMDLGIQNIVPGMWCCQTWSHCPLSWGKILLDLRLYYILLECGK